MTTYFISGHLHLSDEEFQKHYIPWIDRALQNSENGFVVGDGQGVDTMAQTYLQNKTTQVTVYHMFTSPRNNVGPYRTKGGFVSDVERDCQMTRDSDQDIAWIRPCKSERISGTEGNLLRRRLFSL
uniref:Uncharacterized protein n=1 Tax=viral metagenome TaxID=1070528 RepID=A0A6C0BK31_9ZZZZ